MSQCAGGRGRGIDGWERFRGPDLRLRISQFIKVLKSTEEDGCSLSGVTLIGAGKKHFSSLSLSADIIDLNEVFTEPSVGVSKPSVTGPHAAQPQLIQR